MTEPSKAVFLSYASQDAVAAHRLAEGLRAGGVEVWLDTTGLRGGDDKVVLVRDAGVSQLLSDRQLDSLHKDPRWKTLLRKVKLPE